MDTVSSPTSAVSTTQGATPLQQQQARLKKATQEFEALFLTTLLRPTLKEMVGGDSLSDNSYEMGYYQDMMEHRLAEVLAKNGGLGLAKTLYNELAPHLRGVSTNAERKK
ncbi:Rod binding protein [Chthonomonas calidirosea]|uniref:Rod binding protein n=1 Tax=Chthonomonas calidirosea (strain DSM 23976 / ICMP 18418 / T49) TaxID=1303518 RepID=S0EVQ8_CHTCT|nr:rod-binding protein [Chthonomonas calidirosea]CCW35889.1 Rod binding protein [Chthonomonas calidirosea T49]CEK18946.1 Rod binding protein [Chthonomonas calidirosea]